MSMYIIFRASGIVISIPSSRRKDLLFCNELKHFFNQNFELLA